MKPSNKKLGSHILCFFIALFVLCLFLGCGKGCNEKIVPPSSQLKDKFYSISAWLPVSANIVFAIDLYKATHSEIWNKILDTSTNKWLKFIKRSGLDINSELGAVVAFISAGEKEIAGPIFLIQGELTGGKVSTALTIHSKLNGFDLKKERYKGISILTESSNDDGTPIPYSIAALGNGIVAAGKLEDIRWLIDNRPALQGGPAKIIENIDWNLVLWGRCLLNDYILGFVPAPWNVVRSVDISGGLSDDISAKIIFHVETEKNSTVLKSALETLKATEAVKVINDEKILHAISDINIRTSDTNVTVDIPEDLHFLELFMITSESQ